MSNREFTIIPRNGHSTKAANVRISCEYVARELRRVVCFIHACMDGIERIEVVVGLCIFSIDLVVVVVPIKGDLYKNCGERFTGSLSPLRHFPKGNAASILDPSGLEKWGKQDRKEGREKMGAEVLFASGTKSYPRSFIFTY